MLTLAMIVATSILAAQTGPASNKRPPRPEGPCDIYGGAGAPCVAAHSTTRALYASYNGPLYQVLRQSDGKTLDIGVVQPGSSRSIDAGGYADADAQNAFCANTYCWISTIYDQSPKHNDLTQAPRGGFSGPAMGGANNLPIADAAPVTVMGHKVYGAFIAPGMGLRQNDAKGTAVDDQAEGQYWVINGLHYNSGCCFDYGNAEIDSRDDDNGTMETTYYGDSTPWFHGNPPGPWVMTDQENNLVGCVNPDGSKICANLPNITWRFVTAMAKGEPHHWASMGGDAQRGPLSVMFDGPRIDSTYDPMRKQGAILLGNGGDNSNSSQGTFYEGAMTAAGTFPTDATDQRIQANVVAARYGVALLSVAPAWATATPPGLQTFSPGSSQNVAVTFTNTTAQPAVGVKLSITPPGPQWTAVVAGSTDDSKTFRGPVAPGDSVNATFRVTSGTKGFNGDLLGNAEWTNTGGAKHAETAVEKVRNVSPIKINEFRISTGTPANPTDSFIELYNAGAGDVDISNWTLTEHPTQQPIFSTVQIPAGTKLPARAFYLLGLSNSGLAVPAHAGDTVVNVASTTGMTVGDNIDIDAGSGVESHKIASLGTAASASTTLWQPVPDGPIITIPIGATNVPVTSVSGFKVGEKIALGYGATFPTVGRGQEQYEVATVTAVGKQGTQAFLGADAEAGATNIKVTSVADISVGDKIRLDIDSKSHGIEIVTVTKVGTQSDRTTLAADVSAGTTKIKVRGVNGFKVGDKLTVGTPANQEVVAVTAVGTPGTTGSGIDFAPALVRPHTSHEMVVAPGTGLDLAAPLKFNHAANLPFSDRGTGISFQPASTFAHSSNEPIQALGTGIKLDGALAKDHEINAVVHDGKTTNEGYQGSPAPNQWFGGPVLVASDGVFGGRVLPVRAGSMVLRDSSGLVVDSLNYGLIVDPWIAEGYQAVSGSAENGCRVTAPAAGTSASRFPDGHDADSNCMDFRTAPGTALSAPSEPGTTNIKVATVTGLAASQTIRIGTGADLETAVIATVGTPGGTAALGAVSVGATDIPVGGIAGFSTGEAITVGSGANTENVSIAGINRPGAIIILTKPLALAHPAGTQVAGTGITLTQALKHAHADGTQITGGAVTPGAPNQDYSKR
jgi:non-reducing end alpha-L-arabinofuranosidase